MNNSPLLKKEALLTHIDIVLYYFTLMDVDMINDLLDNDRTYQDFAKDKFILKLDYAFTRFKEMGDDYLTHFSGTCESGICVNANCKGYSFVGNHSKNNMNLIFDIKNGHVLDIYDCQLFKTDVTNNRRKATICIDEKL